MMKMKIILAVLWVALITGCQTRRGEDFVWDNLGTDETTQVGLTRPVRAVMLLPLTGKSAAAGQAFRNGGMMALQEHPDSPLRLLFFDTQGTADGTRAAWQEAKHLNPDVIIGPVFASSVTALKNESPRAPVISFTTDHTVLESDIYTMGILIPNQVDRLVQYMCEAGHKNIAVMGPEDKTGELTMNALMSTVKRCPGMQVNKISLYAPDTVNFNPAVLKIVPKPVNPKKKDLTEEEKIILATPIQERLDFDALFLFDDGVRLQQVASLLSYYDLTPKVIPFYGLANWQTVKDKNMENGIFVSTPTTRVRRFSVRYNALFGAQPPRIASLAYDTVSLMAVLAEKQALTTGNLEQEQGFNGVNGRFRFHRNGTNERLLEIFRFPRNMRPETIEPAPATFPDPDTLFVTPEPDIQETGNPLFPVE